MPAERIGVMGASMGAGTVGIAFAQEERMASVFLDSPFSNMGDIIVEELAFRAIRPSSRTPAFSRGASVLARIWWRTTPLTVPATSGTAA